MLLNWVITLSEADIGVPAVAAYAIPFVVLSWLLYFWVGPTLYVLLGHHGLEELAKSSVGTSLTVREPTKLALGPVVTGISKSIDAGRPNRLREQLQAVLDDLTALVHAQPGVVASAASLVAGMKAAAVKEQFDQMAELAGALRVYEESGRQVIIGRTQGGVTHGELLIKIAELEEKLAEIQGEDPDTLDGKVKRRGAEVSAEAKMANTFADEIISAYRERASKRQEIMDTISDEMVRQEALDRVDAIYRDLLSDTGQ